MALLTPIPLKTDLLESLQEIVAEQGLKVENVLDELVRQYLQQARRDKIKARFGRVPVLIAFVEDEPLPTYTVRRPQLLHSQ